MRQITEVMTCDICGKTKVTQYVHFGSEVKPERADLLNVGHNENDIYEVRPTQHLCGKCADAISVAVAERVDEIRKKV